jgi:glycosyltransferase involved in cell wall biosynthesis
MKNITVIIPAKIRNPQEAAWLRVALESVPSKTPTIIVNDHSLIPWEDVAAIVDFGKAHVEHLPDDKKGLAAARNWAMKFVLTDFFFPLDADDYLMPDALSIAMTKYPGNGFLYGSTILFDDKQRTTYQARPWDICKLLEAVYWPNGCLQREEDWVKLKGWDETLPLYEDWDYWLRSAKAGIIGHHIPDVLYAYRQNPNGIIQTLKRNPDMSKRAREMIETRHNDLFSGVHPMCSGCGGNKRKKLAGNTPAPAPRNIPVPAPLANGLVLLIYIGVGLESSYYGSITGTCYRFGVKRRKFGYVAAEDVAGLLKMKEGGKYCFTTETPKNA